MKFLLVLYTVVFAVGCSTSILERDFEKEEQEYIKTHGVKAAQDPLYQSPTSDTVVAGTLDNVIVTLYKSNTETRDNLSLQVWSASIFNHNNSAVCVAVIWKLMDFDLITDYPDFVFIEKNSSIFRYATMRQTIWDLSGTKFALPPSGYIKNMIVKTPSKNAKNGEECIFNEDTIEEL